MRGRLQGVHLPQPCLRSLVQARTMGAGHGLGVRGSTRPQERPAPQVMVMVMVMACTGSAALGIRRGQMSQRISTTRGLRGCTRART